MYNLLRKLVRLTDVALEPVVLVFRMMCTVERYIKLASVIETQTLNFFCNFVVVQVSLISKYPVPLKAQKELIFALKDQYIFQVYIIATFIF